MTTRKAKLAFTLKRLRGFARNFWQSKRGMLGVIILLVAGIVAVGAPWLTPFHPINDKSLGGNTAAPSWYRYFPGGEYLSENYYPIQDPEFSNSRSLTEFNVTVDYASYDVYVKAQIINKTSGRAKNLAVQVQMDGVRTVNSPYLFSGLSGTHSFRIVPTFVTENRTRCDFVLWNTGDTNPVVTVSSATTLVAYFGTPSPPSPPPGKGALRFFAILNNQLVNASVKIDNNVTYWTNKNWATVALDPGLHIITAAYQNATLNRLANVTASQITKEILIFDDESALAQNVTSVENVFVQHVSDVGFQNSPGSLAIIFEKGADALPVNSTVRVTITREFYYPYSGIPGRMTLGGSLMLGRIEGVSVEASLILQQTWSTSINEDLFRYNVTKWSFGTSEAVRFPRGKPEFYTEANFTALRRSLDWISPSTLPNYDAQGAYVTLKQLFPKTGNYVYGIEIAIKKLKPSAEAVIYVDKVDIRLLGTAFGILGTDSTGRDVFTQLVYGTRISLIVGLLSTFLSVFIGLIVGLVAAYLGGAVDEILMRFTDALLVLPGLPLIIVLMAVLSQSQYSMTTFIVVIGFLGWMGFARVVRSQVLTLKERPYVEAAKAVGAGTPYILSRHILPNVVSLIYVTLALSVPGAIVAEAALSFLGFFDKTNMSWGRMLESARGRPELWWWVIPPGLAIAVLSLSFILLGYALDEILNPRLRMRR